MRNKYSVTLHLSDGSALLRTCWAESPEHAVRKIIKAEEESLNTRGLTVQDGWANLTGDDHDETS